LDIAEALLPEGLGLKDATPFNILFEGSRPVFIDLLSIECRRRDDPVWLPYAQFVRTFLLPLAAHQFLQMPMDQIFVTRRDGLQPEDVYQACGWWRRLTPPLLSLVSIPAWLTSGASGDGALYQERSTDPAKAQYVVGALLRRLRRTLDRLRPAQGRKSTWSDYQSSTHNYSAEELETKRSFVEQALQDFQPKKVLDIGSNTGLYSEMAAQAGAAVVALDSDPVAAGELFSRGHAANLNVLPLVVNMARPSPALGWRNQEQPSFLERARGSFDGVLMLAIVHHLLVSEGIPLAEIASLAAELTSRVLVVEFVDSEDPMFQRLVRGRGALYASFTRQSFEAAFARAFQTIRQKPVGAHRCLYLMVKQETSRSA
jgi:SAM-dependent methyltransferase